MKERRRETDSLSIFIKAAFFMLTLILILAVLTSMRTGISIFDVRIMNYLRTIFLISLGILGGMALILFVGALFMQRNTSFSRRSTLIKDGTLRYETVDEKGRRKKKNVDLKNIDRFLCDYSELYMVKDTRLYKEDKKARPNVNTLFVVLPDGRKMSLKKLDEEDPELYDQIGAFLDRIEDKDSIDLSFRMRKYAAEEDLILQGREISAKLKDLKRKVRDKEVLEKIDVMRNKLEEREGQIIDQADKIRKLYDHYLPMLVEITEEYVRMEGHDKKIVDIEPSKKRLLDTFTLIENALDSFGQKEEIEYFDELEAQRTDVKSVLAKGREE